jgi:hypothetical protein
LSAYFPPPLLLLFAFLGFFSSSWKLSIPVFVRNALVDCYLKGRERERELVVLGDGLL